ncbi:FAD-binding oxidoreductase [Roseibium sp. RKSG952]|uniref:NAD(P)/FAD-dependent oxidoreductase n=1 Tax=Roseibium sp. RKSG952 TaxID=2529384 RepID=UPI0012BCCA5F|nr:FAD-binding oxidoreductase [Roseibium sp. RKSG952]MTH96491.1 FAD-binding oxidoreductase [Roseibium sp. RKSG952]
MLKSLDLLTANDKQGAYPPSYYAATANRSNDYPRLESNFTCDVCVIGGGYTGLSSALHLAQRGYKVALLEAHKVGWGASGRNGGQIGPGQRVEQTALEQQYGMAHAKALWDLSLQSMSLLLQLVRDHEIACDLKPGVLHAEHRQDRVGESRDYVEHLARVYNYDNAEFVDRDKIQHMVGSPSYFGGMVDWGAGHLHPLNYALGLATAAEAAGVRIFENSKVVGYEAGDTVTVATETGSVQAGFLVFGCNGYLGRLDGTTAAHVMPINNFIVATEPFSEEDARSLIRDRVAVADSKFVINYFRLSADNRLLFGGGETYGYRFPSDIREFVRKPMTEIYPQLKDIRIDYGWGGTLAITAKRMPYFARIAPNVLTACGYSGHGVAMATLAGQICAEAVDGISGRFDIFERLNVPAFPGGTALRHPLLVLAMTWYSMRDRLGI